MITEKNDILLDPEFIKKLQRLQVMTKKTFTGRMKGERRSKKKGISIEFADYRRYVKGDDIRFVDWNIYSRLETLFMKLFMEEEDLYVYLFVDASKSMGFGAPTKLLCARRTAAALAYIGLNNLDKVGIGIIGADMTEFLKPIRGKQNTFTMLEFLSNIGVQPATNLIASCRRFILSNYPRGIAVLISDFLDPAGFEDAINLFIQRNYEIYVIQILSEEELNPALVGHLELSDSEFAIKTHVSITRDLIKRYQENVNRFCSSLKQFCTKRGVSYIFMKNTSSVEDLVLNYLKYRGLLR